VSQLVMLPAMAVLLDYKRVDSRAVSLVGLGLILASCVGSSFLTVYWNRDQFYLWQLLQAVGQPMVIMPLLMMSTNTVAGPAEGPSATHPKVATKSAAPIKFVVSPFKRRQLQSCDQGTARHAGAPRAGGAMNSGPTGSAMVSRRIRSISALAEASSDQPVTSSTGCN
jgi:hypothetical protein